MASRNQTAGPLAVEWVPLDRLRLNPSNPRINDDAVPHVAASLTRFGWQQPIVAKRDGEVIAGNTRLKAAKSLSMQSVPVVWFGGSDLEAVAFGIADNKLHDLSSFDQAALAQLIEELRREDVSFDGLGFAAAEITELLAELQAQTGADVEDPGPGELPEEPVTRPGDLWVLGKHRLLCGDSTKPDDIGRLLAGEKAALLATDPPYLVDYDGTNHPAEHHKKAGRKPGPGKQLGNKHWDAYVDPESSVEFFSAFLRAALAHCVERVPVYQWHASRRQSLVEEAWKANGLLVHQTIIWVKARGILTRSHYLWQHEPAFYGWPEGFMPEKHRRPPTTETTIWQIDQAGQQDGIHPTQKPLELFERPMRSHTRPGEICFEPFSGSGTQIIAAEKLGRRCRALEISPAFVDVAVNRWEGATGKKATLDGSSGESFAEVAGERGVPCSAG